MEVKSVPKLEPISIISFPKVRLVSPLFGLIPPNHLILSSLLANGTLTTLYLGRNSLHAFPEPPYDQNAPTDGTFYVHQAKAADFSTYCGFWTDGTSIAYPTNLFFSFSFSFSFLFLSFFD